MSTTDADYLAMWILAFLRDFHVEFFGIIGAHGFLETA